jgi:subtilisin family serine protease
MISCLPRNGIFTTGGSRAARRGADIRALAAWDLQNRAEDILVAVIDSGVRYTHEDLAADIWNNPGEIAGNGADDDHNGYVDDVHGINAITGSGNPMDDHGHGTHVAGIIGAAGNNTVGIAGVAWGANIMACKFLDFQLQGVLSDAIECIDYARRSGARIINASWGMPSYNTPALFDAINSLRQAGILFVAACGNSTNNNDTTTPIYPASFNLDNIIAVAATTSKDTLASFSSYGPTTVDLGAPGDTVLSCWAGNDTDYNNFWGTSMAAPHVAGACALVWARFPNENYLQIKNRVLAGVDRLPALQGKCVTGGRLNLRRALDNGKPTLILRGYGNGQCQLRLLGPPGTTLIVQHSANLSGWVSFATNQTSSSGVLDLSDSTAGLAPSRCYRAFIAP